MFLMDVHKRPMLVLKKETIPEGGQENYYFRVHSGYNRFYITVMRHRIKRFPGGGSIIESIIITDGGSMASKNDYLGPPDGIPDEVLEYSGVYGPMGEGLGFTPEKDYDLRNSSEKYRKYLEIFDAVIKEIKKHVL